MKRGATTLSSLEALVSGSAGSWGQFIDVEELSSRYQRPSEANEHPNLHRSRTCSGRLSLTSSRRNHSTANLSMLWAEASVTERDANNNINNNNSSNNNNNDKHHEDVKKEATLLGFVFRVSSPTSECSIWSMDSGSESEYFDEEQENTEDSWDCFSEEEQQQQQQKDESSRFSFESKFESVGNDLVHFKTNNTATFIDNKKSLATACQMCRLGEDEFVVEEIEMKESRSFTISQGITFSFS